MAMALPPPAANNAAFLALFAQLPVITRNNIFHGVWNEQQFVNPAANRVHNFGQVYIHNLGQNSYNALSVGLQDTIALETFMIGAGGAVAAPAAMRTFVNAMLP